ncbi:MAG TPA: AsmA-like C-terminal region-containing protein [Candidatus Binatia bacterium]|nr:AsmA-like C-terminal region-containing protein [Candidatus Binatia bacterium]
MVSTASPPVSIQRRPPAKKLVLVISALVTASAIGLVVLATHWPFSKNEVLEDLREASDSQVTVRSFRETFFPSPGCVLEGVVFAHAKNELKPLITIDRVTVRGSYHGLLTQHVEKIVAEGMRVSVPAFGTGQALHTTKSKITVDEIIANGAIVDFAYHDRDHTPLQFDVHEARLRNVSWNGPMNYEIRVHNPEPPGEVSASGLFGVWNQDNPGETPVSGEYHFENADLSFYKAIAGTLSSQGKFSGKVSHIDISGNTNTPDFEVKSSGHKVNLTAAFTAYVDAIHGDTFLERVEADLWKTHIVAEGSVAKSANGPGKTAILNLRSVRGRIQDLLMLFITANRSPMSGPVTFKARAEIPPGPGPFLKKIKLRGQFGIEGGAFSDASTQQSVNKLSASALGEKDKSDPETALTDLSGEEDLANGVTTFTNLSFGIAGAHARFHGTYNLLNQRIDLRGKMRVDTKISKTESGAKALLLKAMDPFFRKKKNGEVVPVHIGGTYDHPTYGLDLGDKNTRNPRATPGGAWDKKK